jgi:hypothetical protein
MITVGVWVRGFIRVGVRDRVGVGVEVGVVRVLFA